MHTTLNVLRKNMIIFWVCLLFTASCAAKTSEIKDAAPVESLTTANSSTKDTSATTAEHKTFDVIKVPGGTTPSDKRYNDVIEALTIALEKTKAEYGDYELIVADNPMTGSRFVEEVKSGETVNVIWRTYSPELSNALIPIYIDPRKGLLGYRLFLIRKEDQAKFAEVKTLSDLQNFTSGQGQDWLDIQVFEHNQLEVVTGSDYEGLFKMLVGNRFDYFSRGVGEIYTEYEDRKDSLPDLHIESELALYYPWPYFYYVSPNEKRIAQRIEKGLNIMLKDGSLDALFNKYNKSIIEKANLRNRHIIHIENPFLKDAPIDWTNKALWYNPEE